MSAREQVRRLWSEGVDNYAEIARRVGVSRERVRQILGNRRESFNPVAALNAALEAERETLTGTIPGEADRWPWCLACYRKMDGPDAEVARPGNGTWKNAPVCNSCRIRVGYHRHRTKRCEYKRQHRAANPELARAWSRRSEARRRAGLPPQEKRPRRVLRAAQALLGDSP